MLVRCLAAAWQVVLILRPFGIVAGDWFSFRTSKWCLTWWKSEAAFLYFLRSSKSFSLGLGFGLWDEVGAFPEVGMLSGDGLFWITSGWFVCCSSEDGIGLGLGLVFGSCLALSVSEDASSVVTLLLEALAPERVWAGIVGIFEST